MSTGRVQKSVGYYIVAYVCIYTYRLIIIIMYYNTTMYIGARLYAAHSVVYE